MTFMRPASELVALHTTMRVRAFEAVGPKLAAELACGCGGPPAGGGKTDKDKPKESANAAQR